MEHHVGGKEQTTVEYDELAAEIATNSDEWIQHEVNVVKRLLFNTIAFFYIICISCIAREQMPQNYSILVLESQ